MQIVEIPFIYQFEELWSAWMFIQVCHSDLKKLEQQNKSILIEVMICFKPSVALGLVT